MRRVVSTVAFGLHRVRADGARSALVAAGVAAAGLLLAAVLLGSLVAQERALADSVDALAPPVRTMRAAWFGVPGQGDVYEDLDSRSRAALGSVTSGTPTATVLFRESSVEGRYVSLGAVDGLARVGARDERASAQSMHGRAVRGAAAPRAGRTAQGLRRRRARRAPFDRVVRRRSARGAQPARPCAARPSPAARRPLPPACAAAALARRRRARSGGARSARRDLSKLRLGHAASRRRRAPLADRRPRRERCACPHRASGPVRGLRPRGSRGGAACCSRTDQDRGAAPAPARRAGRRAAPRVRSLRGDPTTAALTGFESAADAARRPVVAARPRRDDAGRPPDRGGCRARVGRGVARSCGDRRGRARTACTPRVERSARDGVARPCLDRGGRLRARGQRRRDRTVPHA